jgi:hypothetical protein
MDRLFDFPFVAVENNLLAVRDAKTLSCYRFNAAVSKKLDVGRYLLCCCFSGDVNARKV